MNKMQNMKYKIGKDAADLCFGGKSSPCMNACTHEASQPSTVHDSLTVVLEDA